MPIWDLLTRLSKKSLMVIAVVLVGLTGVIDHITGAEIQVAILYLIPVALASWYLSLGAGFTIAVLSSVVWLVTDYTASHVYSHPFVAVWNAAVFLCFFLLVGNLLNKVHSTLYRLHQTLDHLDAELTQAAQYVLSLLPAPIREGDVRAHWCFIPSKALGGDSLGYHWIDENHLAIYVVDVCGHGVGPALHSVSVMNVLRFQSLSDTDFCSPREVMAGLNKRFPMENYNGTFFTAWYGVYDRSSCRLTYSSAGHPPAVLVLEKHGDGPRTELLQTANLFVGGLADTEYDEGFFLVNEFCRLYVFSDGVYEITRKDGSMWTFREFFLFLTQCSELGGSDLDHLFHHVLEITGRDVLDDDFTIVEVSLGCHEVQAG